MSILLKLVINSDATKFVNSSPGRFDQKSLALEYFKGSPWFLCCLCNWESVTPVSFAFCAS